MSRLQKVLVFTLTFLGYAGLHCLRQGWSYSKSQLQDAFRLEKAQLGITDTLYLVSYSFGMATIGNLVSKINLTYYVAFGMMISSLFYMSFSLIYLVSDYFSFPILAVAMTLNGFFQSTGWPGVMGIMGNWFGKGKRGLLMGVWGINANIGNIIASVMCNIIQYQQKWAWTSNFLFTGGFAIIIAILILLFLKEKPKQKQNVLIDGQIQNEQLNQQSILTENIAQVSATEAQVEHNKKISVLTAFFLPRVPFYVIGYASLKGCMYGLLFWLPTYLDEIGLKQEKGYIASMVDLGSFIGGLIVGYLGDKYSYRALFLSPFLIIGAVVMFIVSFALTNVAWTYYVGMFAIGLVTGGPYNIIGSAITIDLGEQAGKSNIGKVSALIEGSGAIFAAVSQLVISAIPFEAIFYLFCGECMIAAVALFPLFLRDYKDWKYR